MARDKPGAEPAHRAGFFGGMFDPIHFGHLLAAQLAAEELELGEVLFTPAGIPPHRSRPGTEKKHRLEMTRRAVADNPLFEVCDKEIDKDSPAYTVETLEELVAENPETEFFLLVGSDELAEFKNWHRWEDILQLVRVAGINRPGTDLAKVDDNIRQECRLVEIPEIDISSTKIRARRRKNLSLRYQLPESVRKIIQKYSLYLEN